MLEQSSVTDIPEVTRGVHTTVCVCAHTKRVDTDQETSSADVLQTIVEILRPPQSHTN